MSIEEQFGSSAAELALQDLPGPIKNSLIAHALKLGTTLDSLDHVPPDLENYFSQFRARYSYWLSGGYDGSQATQVNTEGLFGVRST